jgi:predicted nucleotidyltransferase
MQNKMSIEDIAKKYNFKLIVLFGSYLQPYYNELESDIDVAVYPNNDFDYDVLKSLLIDFSFYFHKGNIDIVNLKTAPLLLKQQISENGKMLYEEKEGVYENYMDYYQKLFMENHKYFKEYSEKLKKEIKEAVQKWEN